MKEFATMNVTVKFEAQLRTAAGAGALSITTANSCSLLELLRQLALEHGETLRDRLLTVDGQPQPSVLLFVNEQPVPTASAATHRLNEDDSILLYPPISGG